MLDNYKGELLASNCAFLIWWNRRGFFLFRQLPDSYLGLEIFMNVDQFIIVYYLKKEVWGFESYSLFGTTCFQWNYFIWSLRFFFSCGSSKYHLTPLPIKKVDYPHKRGQNWGSYVHNSLPRFNWDYRSCFHTWKRLVCPDLCILAPLLTQVKLSFFSPLTVEVFSTNRWIKE